MRFSIMQERAEAVGVQIRIDGQKGTAIGVRYQASWRLKDVADDDEMESFLWKSRDLMVVARATNGKDS